MAGVYCRWDWLVDLSALINGVADEVDACDSAPQHTAVVERAAEGGGLHVRIDVDVCATHYAEAQSTDGYQRSIRIRQT